MVAHKAEPIVPYKGLFLVLLALLILTAFTVAVAQVDLGALNVWMALLIASTKGTLVLLYFMHLKYESGLAKVGFVVTVVTLAIFIGFMFFDLSFRY